MNIIQHIAKLYSPLSHDAVNSNANKKIADTLLLDISLGLNNGELSELAYELSYEFYSIENPWIKEVINEAFRFALANTSVFNEASARMRLSYGYSFYIDLRYNVHDHHKNIFLIDNVRLKFNAHSEKLAKMLKNPIIEEPIKQFLIDSFSNKDAQIDFIINNVIYKYGACNWVPGYCNKLNHIHLAKDKQNVIYTYILKLINDYAYN